MAPPAHISVAEDIVGNVIFRDREYESMSEEPTHYRLCYHRAGLNWRVRNERTGELWLVDKYEGDINLNYLDRGSHIFHDGVVQVENIDGQDVAILSDPV